MINSIDVSEKTNEELIKDLESKKAEAVASDDFEEAIKIRDQIKELKSKETTEESKSNISEKADQIEANTQGHKKEMDDMKTKADEEKNSKMNDLMGQLNGGNIEKNDVVQQLKEERIIKEKKEMFEQGGQMYDFLTLLVEKNPRLTYKEIEKIDKIKSELSVLSSKLNKSDISEVSYVSLDMNNKLHSIVTDSIGDLCDGGNIDIDGAVDLFLQTHKTKFNEKQRQEFKETYFGV